MVMIFNKPKEGEPVKNMLEITVKSISIEKNQMFVKMNYSPKISKLLLKILLHSYENKRPIAISFEDVENAVSV